MLNGVLKRTFQHNTSWYFWIPGIDGKPLTFVKFAWLRLRKVGALLLLSKIISCNCVLNWRLKRIFQHITSWYLLPEQFSVSTFHQGTYSLSLNMVFLNLRYWVETPDFHQNLRGHISSKVLALLLGIKFQHNTSWYWSPVQFLARSFTRAPFTLLNMVFLNPRFWKAQDFCQSLPDQGSCKVLALLLRSNFHSCKCVLNWVLKRTLQHITSWYWSPEQFSGSTIHQPPLFFPFLWYFWITGIYEKPLTYVKIRRTKAPQAWCIASTCHL